MTYGHIDRNYQSIQVERFKALLSGYDITFYTLQDLQIRTEPEEKGNTPEENAILRRCFMEILRTVSSAMIPVCI